MRCNPASMILPLNRIKLYRHWDWFSPEMNASGFCCSDTFRLPFVDKFTLLLSNIGKNLQHKICD